MSRTTVGSAICIAILSFEARSRAAEAPQTVPSEGDAATPDGSEERPAAERGNGLDQAFLRAGSGLGYATSSSLYRVDTTDASGRFGTAGFAGRWSGTGPLLDLAVGVVPHPLVAVGIMYQGLWLTAPVFHSPIPDVIGVHLRSAQHSLIAGFAEFRFWSSGLHVGGAVGWGWWSPSFDGPPPDVELNDAEGVAFGFSFGWKHRLVGVVDGDLAIEPWASCFHAIPGLSQISLLPTLGFNAVARLSIH